MATHFRLGEWMGGVGAGCAQPSSQDLKLICEGPLAHMWEWVCNNLTTRSKADDERLRLLIFSGKVLPAKQQRLAELSGQCEQLRREHGKALAELETIHSDARNLAGALSQRRDARAQAGHHISERELRVAQLRVADANVRSRARRLDKCCAALPALLPCVAGGGATNELSEMSEHFEGMGSGPGTEAAPLTPTKVKVRDMSAALCAARRSAQRQTELVASHTARRSCGEKQVCACMYACICMYTCVCVE